MSLSHNKAALPAQNLHSIQHLRAVAALLVVAFHLHLVADKVGIKSGLLAAVARFGEVGVDIFFVLSGFLMLYTTRNKQPGVATALDFMRARVVRIVPLYWILTIVFASALLAFPALFDDHPFDLHHLWTSLLFIPSYNAAGAAVPVIYTGWTLNYEMFFYVIFAATLCFTRKYLFPVIAVVFLALCLFRLAAPANLFWHVYTSPLLLEFVAGCGIALLSMHGKAMTWKLALPCLAAGVLLIPALAGHSPHRAVHYGVPAALIVFGVLALEKDGKWFRFSLLRAIGDSSYSLYLTHAFTLPIILRLLARTGTATALPPAVAAFAIVAVCAVAGHVCYIVVEKRLTQWTRTKRTDSALVAVPG